LTDRQKDGQTDRQMSIARCDLTKLDAHKTDEQDESMQCSLSACYLPGVTAYAAWDSTLSLYLLRVDTGVTLNIEVSAVTFTLRPRAGLRVCKNRPTPFPGRMS